MTINLAMNNLNGILKEATESEDSVCYVTENDAETLQVAIETMRKYQKIKEIHKEYTNTQYEYIGMQKIGEVLKDGNKD